MDLVNGLPWCSGSPEHTTSMLQHHSELLALKVWFFRNELIVQLPEKHVCALSPSGAIPAEDPPENFPVFCQFERQWSYHQGKQITHLIRGKAS